MGRLMHIAMLSGEYPPRWGGMGSTVFHLSGALARMGHRVTVITRREAKACEDASIIPRQVGVEVRMVRWTPLPMAFTRSYGNHALKELLALHAEQRVDAVHVHAPMISWSPKQYALVRAEIGNVTTSLHGSWLGERDGMRRAARLGESAAWKNPNDLAILATAGYYAKYERAAVRGSTVCVANSEATKRDFLARYEPPDNWRVEVVRWGVDINMFHPQNHDEEDAQLAHEAMRRRYGQPDDAALRGDADTSTPLLLAVGRLAGRKGFRTLLKAMPLILTQHPGTQLVIVGRGKMRRTLLKQAERLGVKDAVTIESGMSFDNLAQLFRSADLTVYPSLYEGQGLIPLESMASGTPCATVDDGPLPEMVDESVGGLFQVGNPSSLAEVVNGLLSDPTLRVKMTTAGRERVVEHYTYDKNAEKYAEFYSEQ